MAPQQKRVTAETGKIEKWLKENFPDIHPDYPPQAYRYNSASIRVRLVSDLFRGKGRGEREEMVLPLIRKLPTETRQDITLLVLLPPEELMKSPLNTEFEHPSPSPIK